MLPTPVSFSSRSSVGRNDLLNPRYVVHLLLSPARVTNLGFLLLGALTFLSALANLNHFYFSVPPSPRNRLPASILSTITRRAALWDVYHLVVVPGHAIWKGVNPDMKMNEDEWLLEPYQKGGGRISAFFRHITLGAELVVNDEHSLLVFSGGQTHQTSTTTEAESYMRLALSSKIFHTPTSKPFLRATTENYALDSFQNLLFSIARFHEYTGRYPEKITVIGHQMKKRRFEELHRAAIRWPKEKFDYVGIDIDDDHSIQAHEGEQQNGYGPYSLDMYGCHSYLLSKRRRRNTFQRFHSYYTSAPELGTLMDWCPDATNGGSTVLFNGHLPWDPM